MFIEGRKDILAGLIVAAIAFLLYANSLGNGFVWDDTNIILTNPALLGSPFTLFKSIDVGRDYELLPYYRPLTLLTFLMEGRLYGFNPSMMHLINILLHTVNAFLVYRLAFLLIGNRYTALLAGLLFALHPINTEAVDFISGGRNTMLACFLILAAYLLHYRSVIRHNLFYGIAGALCFLAGMFSKEAAIVVLPFIIVQEIAPLRGDVPRSKSRSVLRLSPYLAAAVCYLIMRWITLSHFGIQNAIIPGFGSDKLQSIYKIPELSVRLLDNLYIIPRYLLAVIWPAALSPRYMIPEDLKSIALPLAAEWLCIIGILFWLFTRGRSRAALFGLAWLVAFYLPVSGIVWFPSAPMAERYIYIPAIGLWLITADQAVRLFPSRETARKIGVTATALFLIILAGLTARRNMDWQSDITLFTRFVKQYPDNFFAHAGLGEAYFNLDREDEQNLKMAEEEFEKVLALRPILPPGVHTKLGYIRLARGDSEGAVYYYTIALGIYPLDKEALLNRGIAMENLGRQEEAAADFRRFLSVPGYELAEARPYAETRIRALTR
ncbi:MAG: tetratricopeptide repeat protein [Nitrospirota bacterium]